MISCFLFVFHSRMLSYNIAIHPLHDIQRFCTWKHSIIIVIVTKNENYLRFVVVENTHRLNPYDVCILFFSPFATLFFYDQFSYYIYVCFVLFAHISCDLSGRIGMNDINLYEFFSLLLQKIPFDSQLPFVLTIHNSCCIIASIIALLITDK